MKLKRCPICNGKAVMHERNTFEVEDEVEGDAKPFYYVECSDCCLGYYSIAYDTIEGAAKEWNDRSKAEAALKKKLKKELAKERDFSIIPSYPIPIGKFEPYKAVTITITAHSGV